MEKKLKHLEMIQGVINRLSTNSFLLKGWSVVLVSALLTLSVAEHRSLLALVALLPAAIFWGLDGFFLWQERNYRHHYDLVRRMEEDQIDFSMTAKSPNHPTCDWINAVLSRTLIPFHSVLVVAIMLAIILAWNGG